MELPLGGKHNYGIFLYSNIYLIYFVVSGGIITILDILLIYLLSGETESLVPNGSYSLLFYLFFLWRCNSLSILEENEPLVSNGSYSLLF